MHMYKAWVCVFASLFMVSNRIVFPFSERISRAPKVLQNAIRAERFRRGGNDQWTKFLSFRSRAEIKYLIAQRGRGDVERKGSKQRRIYSERDAEADRGPGQWASSVEAEILLACEQTFWQSFECVKRTIWNTALRRTIYI